MRIRWYAHPAVLALVAATSVAVCTLIDHLL
jgi:hypothetical protein